MSEVAATKVKLPSIHKKARKDAAAAATSRAPDDSENQAQDPLPPIPNHRGKVKLPKVIITSTNPNVMSESMVSHLGSKSTEDLRYRKRNTEHAEMGEREPTDRLKLPPINKPNAKGAERDEEDKKKTKKSHSKKKAKGEKKRDLFDILNSKKNPNDQTTEEAGSNKIRFADVFQLTDKDFEQVNLDQLHRFQMNEAFFKDSDPANVREFKRRLQAEEKRRELLKRRKDQNEQKIRDAQEAKRKEKVAHEIELENKRREQELRLKEIAEAAKRKREEEASLTPEERLARRKAEEDKKLLDEYLEKVAEFRRKRAQEMLEKARIEHEKRMEEERLRSQEEKILSGLNDEQKVEYFAEKKRAQEAELMKAEIMKQEEDRRQIEELHRVQDEARQAEAEETARKMHLEMRLSFLKSLQQESELLENSHLISRSFVFSYYDMLRYLDKKISKNRENRLNENIAMEALAILKRYK